MGEINTARKRKVILHRFQFDLHSFVQNILSFENSLF